MAARRTFNFLPSVFQTDTNRKFLSATLDQLVSEPEFTRLNGFVGRKYAPTYKSGDSYISEINNTRQNYQLEPSVVIKNSSDQIEFYSTYTDLLDKISYYGGKTDNHNRLFSSEYYTFSGLFDHDKFVNYQQYYWLPNGPIPVLINSEIVNANDTFTVSKDVDDNCFRVDSLTGENPEIVVARGGTYKFKTADATSRLYIQTEPGVSGKKRVLPNISSRAVYGVSGNGASNGVIEFRVPLVETQDVYLKMPQQRPVDYAISISMTELDGANWDDIVSNFNGFDGLTYDPTGRLFIFLSGNDDDVNWTRADGTVVAIEHRRGVWRIRVVEGLVELDYIRDVPIKNRLYPRLGRVYANVDFYKTTSGHFLEVPALTAQLDTLYYQDASNPNLFGKIRIVDNAVDSIEIDSSILGKKNYTTNTGVEFTNGLVVKFDGNVTPTKYANRRFVVEGVGTAIRLVSWDHLVFPESGIRRGTVPVDLDPWDDGTFDEPYQGPLDPEYICMNRSSLDLNAWARHNRWFHIDVITKAAEYNNTVPKFDQATRAKRPIIEFDADLQLLNNGRVGKRPVDHIITSATSAFNQIQHKPTITIDGIKLNKGDRVLFPNDTDPLVRSQIYVIDFEIQSEPSYHSYQDGFGQGTITILPRVVNYKTAFSPELVEGPDVENRYTYSWIVAANSDINQATEILGLNVEDVGLATTIQTVTQLGNNQYILTFQTNFEIQRFDIGATDIVMPGGLKNVLGNGTKFTEEFETGSVLYTEAGYPIGTVSAVTSDSTAVLETFATVALDGQVFQYKNPRIQLIVSSELDDALEPYDVLVATAGNNVGKSYWYDGNLWYMANTKTGVNQAILFDAFDNKDTSFSTYRATRFAGTKLFSYKQGTGTNDAVLGFPISYTNVGTVTNTSIADITFVNNLGSDSFEYLVGNDFVSVNVDTGYIRKNLDRSNFEKKTCWATVNEPSKQYQVISNTYTGKTNHFEIDVLPLEADYAPNIKVFLNNELLTADQYVQTKVGVRHTVKVNASLLTAGDKVDILIYSNAVSDIGYYQIPINLDFNSKNEQLKTVTLGQIRNNLITVAQNNVHVIGSPLGDTSMRDISIKNYGGNILQNSAPLIYAQLFLIDQQANFVDSVDYARKEYTKFKNRFVEMCSTLAGLDPTDPKSGVDRILSTINSVKNKSFPFFYSDMLAYGEADVKKYTVLEVTQKQYKLVNKFDDTQVQARAVLVYHNNKLLVKGIDYVFNTDRPAITILDTVQLVLGDSIEIRDYSTTDGNCIPPTPTKLGLYPKSLPEIELDITYRNPIYVIRGHDGSITPAYNDFRDDYIIELERRIYNNIKRDYSLEVFDIRSLIPGRFRETDYTLTEFSNILNVNFMKWAGANKVDYIDNSSFVGGDPFTYNYSQSKDRFDSYVPGYWRGIYQYYFDTDCPNLRPWEMLGFSIEPEWWGNEYGPAPYTRDNEILWTDIENGLIRHGPTAGTHKQYQRPGLMSMLPVDSAGNLLPPQGTVIKQFNSNRTSDSWKIGDVGPAESAWRRSSEYPYALQIAAALMKPAVYFGTLIDTTNYAKDKAIGQYVNIKTSRRITPVDVEINGELNGSTVLRGTGYINWIVDYLTGIGINGASKVRGLLDNLEVQLSYKVAGYTDKKHLTILAEQYSPTSTNESVVIPDDSYKVYLNKSVPVEKIVYSAVVIEKTSTGYAVNGYSTNNPYFVVIPSDTAGDKYAITVDSATATIYKNYRKQKLVIPYGTEFTTKQQVVDFLVSYQRALFAQGFVFDQYNDLLATTQDWVLSAREFLSWTMQGWKPGNVLVLSPINTELRVLTENSVVDQITNDVNGSRVLDTNFTAIKSTELTVLRDNGEFKLTSVGGKTIAFAQLNLVQYEHVLILDNKTVFNDIVYKPESGSRQYRLKLVGNKTANWNGSLNPAGFVYNDQKINSWKAGKDYLKGDIVTYKGQYYVGTQSISASAAFDITQWKQIDKSSIKTGLLPNFANNAGRFINIYDIDTDMLDSQWSKMSNGLIGFRDRAYLSDLNVVETSQAKFYQGYIKEKGTKKAVTNLLNASFNDLSNAVDFYEEWAVRVGEYGATESTQTVEIALDEVKNKNNPTAVAIIGDTEQAPEGIIGVRVSELWNKPYGAKSIKFINRPFGAVLTTDIQSAGYVNVDDYDAALFSADDYTTLNKSIDDIISGYVVWVAKDRNTDWNCYRASETDTTVVSMAYGLDNVATITTNHHHELNKNQIIAVRTFDSRFDGFFVINSIVDDYKFTVTVTDEQNKILKQNPVNGNGLLFALHSVRFNSPSKVVGFTPRHGWRDGDRVWVDKSDNDGWAVYEKNSVYDYKQSVDIKLGATSEDVYYGTTVKLDDNNKFIVVGAPSDAMGLGRLHVFQRSTLKEIGVLNSEMNGLVSLGHSLDMANNRIVAGAPDSYNGQGAVVVYGPADNAFFTPVQLIGNPLRAGNSKFGYSVSLSKDGQNLYIGDPYNSTVYFYEYTEKEKRVTTFEVISSKNGCRMPYTVTEPESLAVYLRGKLLLYGRDWVLENDQQTITLIPENFPTIVWGNNQIIVTEVEAKPLESEFGLGNPGAITIIQRSYYKLISNYSTSRATDHLGWSLKTNRDGTQLIAGAPGETVNGVMQAGKAYVFSKDNRTSTPSWAVLKVLKPENPVYRGRYGSSVELCVNSCSAYVGAPGYSDYNYAGGVVYRYVNPGKLLGAIVGKVENPTVTVGHSLIINGSEVVFTGTTLESVAADINGAIIVGVSAAVVEGKLSIRSVDTVQFDKLSITPGVGTAITDLGLELFDPAQTIRKPLDTQGENFGEFMRLSSDAVDLSVSSTKGTVIKDSITDSKTTTFDKNATKIIDVTLGSGAVYMHNFLPNSLNDPIDLYGAFVFSEEFNAPSLRLGDQFGSGVDFDRGTLVIGAAYNDIKGHNAGNAYVYNNANGNRGWKVVRQQSAAVDTNGINSISLYNLTTKSKLANLDFIDPIKGKCLGIVEQSLNYKTTQDPAMYNAGSEVSNSADIDFHWGVQQVGQTWWNLAQAKFIDYEQGELVYRLNNWGHLFPGSSVEVYEWVESTVLPSAHTTSGATGTPLHEDDRAYVQISFADSSTGVIKTKYYYWVRGMTSVPTNSSRILSSAAIEKAIVDPKTQNIPYAAILSDNTVALYNCQKFISGKSTVLKVDYDIELNNNVIHSEFALVKEGDKSSYMPDRIVDKIVDSISGIDNLTRRVPDPRLKSSQAIGLEVRPVQTLVIDRFTALKNIVSFVNSVFAQTTAAYKIQNTKKFASARFFAEDPAPGVGEYDFRVKDLTERSYINVQPDQLILVDNDSQYFGRWVLYKVRSDLSFEVARAQTFKTTDVWEYRDWVKDGYDIRTVPDFVVNYYKDIEMLVIKPGDVVRIDNGPLGYEIYKFTTKDSAELVAVENGTIALKDLVWDTSLNGVGFDNFGLESTTFDLDLSQEIRNVLIGLKDDMFVDELLEHYNKLMFVIVQYIMSEQQNVDWIFKTSFISVMHNIKELIKYPNYIRDNHTYYEDYISEVKPYRTKIREYKLSYTGLDLATTDITDFDLPAYYDRDLKRFRSPSGQYPTKDGALYIQKPYKDWADNFTFGIESITLADPGIGFTSVPAVQIVANNDSGTGAEAIAIIDETTGSITKIVVTNAGYGYKSTPYVIINGTGTGARAYAKLSNKKIRRMKTVMKFDRTSYTTDVREWLPGQEYNVGDLVSYKGQGYRAVQNSINNTFSYAAFTLIHGSEYTTAGDRIAATYIPGPNQIPRNIDAKGRVDLSRLIPGVVYNNYAVVNDPTVYNESRSKSPGIGDLVTGNNPEDINVVGATFGSTELAYAPEELVAGTTYDNLNLRITTITDENTYVYTLRKGSTNTARFNVVIPGKSSTLAQPLNYNDKKIYLTTPVSDLSAPNLGAKIPGSIYVNGEIINFWRVDSAHNCILDPIRGVGGTAIPEVHLVDTAVEDVGQSTEIPGIYTKFKDRFVFYSDNKVFTPNFRVTDDMSILASSLTVFNGVTPLVLDVDYTLSPRYEGEHILVDISFVNADRIADGVRFTAEYLIEKTWLNVGDGVPSDGTGFAGAQTEAAMFIKQYPYIIP